MCHRCAGYTDTKEVDPPAPSWPPSLMAIGHFAVSGSVVRRQPQQSSEIRMLASADKSTCTWEEQGMQVNQLGKLN
jgi:hypothetical protein